MRRLTISGDAGAIWRVVAVPGVPMVLLLSEAIGAGNVSLAVATVASLGLLAAFRGAQWYRASRTRVDDDGASLLVCRGRAVVRTFEWAEVTGLAYDRHREIPIFAFALFDKWSRLMIETSTGWHEVELMKVGWRSLVRTERLIADVAEARGVPFTRSSYPGYLLREYYRVVKGASTQDGV